MCRGGARNILTGAASSDEGAKIWFSGYYKGQKSPKKLLFTFRRGASMLRRGAIAPSPPWCHPYMCTLLYTKNKDSKQRFHVGLERGSDLSKSAVHQENVVLPVIHPMIQTYPQFQECYKLPCCSRSHVDTVKTR